MGKPLIDRKRRNCPFKDEPGVRRFMHCRPTDSWFVIQENYRYPTGKYHGGAKWKLWCSRHLVHVNVKSLGEATDIAKTAGHCEECRAAVLKADPCRICWAVGDKKLDCKMCKEIGHDEGTSEDYTRYYYREGVLGPTEGATGNPVPDPFGD